MSENTIFSSKPPTPPPPPPPQRPAAPPAERRPVSTPEPLTKPIPPQFHDSSHGRPLKMLLFGGIGLMIVVIIIFVIVGIALSGAKSSGNVTLTYWGLWEDPSIMNSVIADFERQHPNIKVNYIKQDIKQYRQRVETRINNGDGPDIYRFHNTWLPELSGFLLPLSTTAITSDQFAQQYYQPMQKDLIKNGAIYGIPLEIDDLVMFTNDQLFQANNQQIPKTWIEFEKVAPALTSTDPITGSIKTSGAAIGTYDNVTHAPDLISLLFLQNQADLTDLTDSKRQISTALQFYTQFAQGSTPVWDNNREASIQAFAAGTLGIYFGYSWDIPEIKQLNPNLQFHTSPVPTLPDAAPLTIASYWVEGVSSKTKHPTEAMEFMHFLSQKDTEQKLFTEEAKARGMGEPYAIKSLASSLQGNPVLYTFVSQAESAQSSYFASDTQDDGLNVQANAYLANAVRSMLQNTSADSATDTLIQGVTQIRKQYGQ